MVFVIIQLPTLKFTFTAAQNVGHLNDESKPLSMSTHTWQTSFMFFINYIYLEFDLFDIHEIHNYIFVLKIIVIIFFSMHNTFIYL